MISVLNDQALRFSETSIPKSARYLTVVDFDSNEVFGIGQSASVFINKLEMRAIAAFGDLVGVEDGRVFGIRSEKLLANSRGLRLIRGSSGCFAVVDESGLTVFADRSLLDQFK